MSAVWIKPFSVGGPPRKPPDAIFAHGSCRTPLGHPPMRVLFRQLSEPRGRRRGQRAGWADADSRGLSESLPVFGASGGHARRYDGDFHLPAVRDRQEVVVEARDESMLVPDRNISCSEPGSIQPAVRGHRQQHERRPLAWRDFAIPCGEPEVMLELWSDPMLDPELVQWSLERHRQEQAQ